MLGLDELYPFFVEVDRAGAIVRAGRSFPKIHGHNPVGEAFADIVSIIQPPAASLDKLVGSREPVVATHLGSGLALKAILLSDTESGNLLVLATLLLQDTQQLVSHGLTYQDFGPLEQSFEFLQLLEIQRITACDLKQTVDRMARERKELRATIAELRNEQRQSKLLNYISEHTDNSVLITDRDLRIVWTNPSFEQVTGYSAEDAIGRKPSELLQGPETDPETIVFMRHRLRRYQPFRVTVRNHRKDGSLFWLELEVQPHFDEHGEVTHYIGIQRDITRQVESEEMVRRRDLVLSAITQFSGEFLWQDDWLAALNVAVAMLGRATLANAAFAVRFFQTDGHTFCQGISRWSRDDVAWPPLGSRPIDLTDVGLTDAYTRLNDGSSVRYADFPYSAVPIFFPHKIDTWIAIPVFCAGALFGALIFTRDLDSREWTEPEIGVIETAASVMGAAITRNTQSADLRRAYEKLESALEGGNMSLWIYDPSDHSIELDATFDQIIGRDLPSLVVPIAVFEEWIHADDREGFMRALTDVLNRRSQWLVHRFRIRVADGGYRWVRVRARPRPTESDNGNEVTLGTIRDIEDQVEAEDRLARMVSDLDDARRLSTQAAAMVQKELLTKRPATRTGCFAVRVVSVPSVGADGDFFDVISVSDTIVDVVVGDVMGKGLTAALIGAGIKAQISRSLGLFASSGTMPSPAQIMQNVHDLMSDKLISLECFVTIAYVRIDAEKMTLQLVDCGHTRIMIWSRKSGKCRFVNGDFLPLGVARGEYYQARSVAIAPGDLVLLYSDGVTELPQATAGSKELGEAGLRALVESAAPLNKDEPWVSVQAALETLAANSEPADDFTFLCVGLPAERVDNLYRVRVLPTQYASIDDVRGFLRDSLADSAIEWTEMEETLFELAAVEAFTNIVRHAYAGRKAGRLELRAEPRSNGLVLHFVYHGEPFEPPSRTVSEEPKIQESGYGLDLIYAAVDSVDFTQDDRGRIWISLFKQATSALASPQ